MTRTKQESIVALVGLTLVLVAGACSKDEPKEGGGAYTTVVSDKTIEPASIDQVFTLGNPGAPVAAPLVVKVPGGSLPVGVTFRRVSGTPTGPGMPVNGEAIELLPAGLTLNAAVRVSMQVPSPQLLSRFVSVKAPSADSGAYEKQHPGRRIGLGVESAPKSESWEFDINSSGVWGLTEDSSGLGVPAEDGALVTDATEIAYLDEEQTVILGPPGGRMLIVVPPAEAAAGPSVPAPIGPTRGPREFVTLAGEGSLVSPGPTPIAQVVSSRPRVVVQTVAPVPMRTGTPIASTSVVRIPTPVSPMPNPPEPPAVLRPVRVIQPLPPPVTPGRMPIPVSSPPLGKAWTPIAGVTAEPSTTPVPGAAPETMAYTMPVDPNVPGYYGLSYGDTPALSPGRIAALPIDSDFGTVLAGSAPVERNITITNSGDSSTERLVGTLAGTDANDFAIKGSPDSCIGIRLSPQTTCVVVLTMSSTAAGMKNALFSIGDGVTTATTTLHGIVASPAMLQADATAVTFGANPVGMAAAPFGLNVRNLGGQVTGPITVSITGVHRDEFRVGTCPQALGPNETCALNVVFTAAAVGNRSASLTLSATPGGTLQLPLSGSGQAAETLQFSPTTHTFSPQLAGEKSAARVFTLTNPGQVTSGVPVIGFGGANASAFSVESNSCTAALGPSQTCAVSVAFAPTMVGAAAALLQASASPGGSTNAALAGTGLAPAMLTATPPALDLGSAIVGASTTLSTVISNVGGVATGPIVASVGGVNAADFVTSDDGCSGQSLAPSATCTLVVRFTPGAPGQRAATLAVTASPGGTATGGLSGNGLAPGNAICFPAPTGVPGLPGVPNWWNEAPPALIDDPRWNGSLQVGHSADDAEMRGLFQQEGADRYLVLSWHVKSDPGFAPDPGLVPSMNAPFDAVFVGLFNDDASVPANRKGVLIRAWRRTSTTTTAGGVNSAYDIRMKYLDSTTAGGWSDMTTAPPVPIWLTTDGRLDATCDGNAPPTCSRWVVRLRLKLDSAGASSASGASDPWNGLPIGDRFKMFWDIQVANNDLAVHHKWPANISDVDESTAPPSYPDVSTWAEAQAGDSTGCKAGVSIDTSLIDVATASAPGSTGTISISGSNILHARPSNGTGGSLGAGALKARFRIGDCTASAGDPWAWRTIPGCEAVTNAGANISAGAHWDLPCTWTQPTGNEVVNGRTACVLVDLSTASVPLYFPSGSAVRSIIFAP